MKRLVRGIILALFGVPAFSGLMLAQDGCGGGWQSISAKTPGSKVVLTLSTGKEGREQLQWPNPTGDLVRLQVYKAKAPVEAQGAILICATGVEIASLGTSTWLLQDLVKQPQPGYYAVRVTLGDPNAGNPGNSSDWITIQIKEPDQAQAHEQEQAQAGGGTPASSEQTNKGSQTGPRTAKLPDATAVRLFLMEALDSATNHAGDLVRFEVIGDVKVGDVVTIARGATAVAHVVEAEPKKSMGRAGKLNFSLDYVKAADGSNVRLRAVSAKKGDDKKSAVIAGAVLVSPLFLIMRGKDVSIPRGTQIMAYVDGDREVALPAAAETTSSSSSILAPASLTVTSAPPGADIQVNGDFMGSTPSTLKLEPGNYTIVVAKKDYTRWERSLKLSAGTTIALDAALVQSPAGQVPPAGAVAAQAALAGATALMPRPEESPAPVLHPVKLNGRWGFADLRGELRVTPQFDSAATFSEGRALVSFAEDANIGIVNGGRRILLNAKVHRYGWIDERGEFVIKAQFTAGSSFSDGIVVAGRKLDGQKYDMLNGVPSSQGKIEWVARHESQLDFLDREGNVVLKTDYAQATPFSEKLAGVTRRWAAGQKLARGATGLASSWGYIDINGRLVIDAKFESAQHFSEGLAAVELDKKWGYIDHEGKFVIGASFAYAHPFAEGLAGVRTDTNTAPPKKSRKPLQSGPQSWGFVDRMGAFAIPSDFEAVTRFSEGLAAVKQDGRWGYVDKSGAFRIPRQFQAARPFQGGFAAVQIDGKWGFIDRTGKVVVPPQFDDAL